MKALVENYLNFFNAKDRRPEVLAPLLAENVLFKGPLGEFSTRAGFLKDLERDALSISEIRVKSILCEGGKACALYDLSSSDPAIGTVRMSEWFEIENEKITSIFSTYDATQVKQLLTKI